jgi:plastocyanin
MLWEETPTMALCMHRAVPRAARRWTTTAAPGARPLRWAPTLRAALLALVGLLGGCASLDSTGTPTRTVTVAGGRFLDPQVLEIHPGDVVQWVNGAAAGGDVQIAFSRPAEAPALGGTIGSPAARFERPGRFRYVATARSQIGGAFGTLEVVLQGEVVVRAPEPAPGPPPPRESPPATPPPAPVPGPSSPDIAPSSQEVVRVRGGREAAAALGWASGQGLVARIDRSTASPARLRPGEALTLEIDWTVVIPSGGGLARVRQAWTIRREGETLTRLERETEVGSGTFKIQRTLPLPATLPPGRYVVAAEVEAAAAGRTARDHATGSFVVAP